MIGFGKLFGLQDIYEGDEVRIQGGAEQDGSNSSVEVTEKNWQDQLDGMSDKWRKGVKKTVHFGGARRIPKEDEDGEELEEKAVATLSLSVQVPAGDVKTLVENGWRAVINVTVIGEAKTCSGDVF